MSPDAGLMVSQSSHAKDAPGASHDEDVVALSSAAEGERSPDRIAGQAAVDRLHHLVLVSRIQSLEAQLERTERRLEETERELERKERRLEDVVDRYEEVLEDRDSSADVCFSWFGRH